MMVDYSNIPRDSRRVPLETRVQFKFDRFSGFLSEYSANISPGGLFLRTRAPLDQGTVLDFEFRLGDGFELIRGRGEVVWSRSEDEGTARPAGMGIRFLELAPGSKELIYRIVDQHILQGGTPFDVTQRPPDPMPPAPAIPAAPPQALPPMAQAFAASLAPTAPPAPAAPAPALAGNVFDLPPAVREPEPKLPDATSWLPSLDDPLLDPLAPPPPPPAWTQEPRLPEPFPELLPAALEPELEAGDLEVPSEYLGEDSVDHSKPSAPMFATTFGAASARPRRRILPLALLAAGLILAAAIFLLRDQVMEMAGLGGEDEPVVQTAPPRLPRRAAPAVAVAEETPQPADPAALEGTPPATSDATPVPAGPEATPAPLAPPPPVAAAPRGKAEPIPAVAEEPETGPALTRLDRITFEQTATGTDIILWGDGAIRAESFTRSRIDGNPPRELIRLSGIRREFSPARVAVGTPEVLQVRVGYHPETGRGELHVVLDLTRPNVVVAGVEPGEHRLRIRLQRK